MSTDKELADRLLYDGSTALVITITDVEQALLPIPQIGLSLLGWKLLHAGPMPCWVMVLNGKYQQVHDHVSTLSLAPGFSGTVLGPEDWSDVLRDHPRVKRTYWCCVDNALGLPRVDLMDHHVKSGNTSTREVAGGLSTGAFIMEPNRPVDPSLNGTFNVSPEDALLFTSDHSMLAIGTKLASYRVR